MDPGKTVHPAEPSSLLIYLLIRTVLFLVMRAMGELLLHNLEYRSFQGFTRDMLGPWARYFVGWTYRILWVVTASVEIVVIVGCFGFWIKDMARSMICTFILLIALLGCDLLTVKLFDEAEFWFTLAEIITILFLIIVGIGTIPVSFQFTSIIHLWSAYGPLGISPANGDNFLVAFQIAMFAFIGIELTGTAVAETSDPYKTLPKATNVIPVWIVIFYVLALAIIMPVTPWDKIDPDMLPSANLLSMAGFTAAAGTMNFVVLTSAPSGANSGIFSTSRMLYGLSQSKQVPESFGHLSKHQVPAKTSILSVVLTYVVFPILVIGESMMEIFTMVFSVSVGLMLFIWSLVLVCYIRYWESHLEAYKNAAFRVPDAAFMPWVVPDFFGFAVYMLLRYDDTRITLGLTFLWSVGLTISWFIRKKVHGGVSR